MVLHLAQRLEIPLRERNHLLLAAGYAPGFSEHSLDERDMGPVREALHEVRTHWPLRLRSTRYVAPRIERARVQSAAMRLDSAEQDIAKTDERDEITERIRHVVKAQPCAVTTCLALETRE
jgi:hypothetical protein